MGRIYQALQKSGGLTAFDPDLSTTVMLDTGRGLPEMPVSPPRDITQAVADLLRDKRLTHSFGVQGEWEVQTMLIANRQVWRYRSRVFMRGKKVSRDFPSLEGERTRHIRRAEAVGEDIAREAVGVHFARCASVMEHIRLGLIPSQPRRWHARMKTMALVLCGVVALVTAYWLWKGSESLRPEQPPANQPEWITPTPQLPGHWTW